MQLPLLLCLFTSLFTSSKALKCSAGFSFRDFSQESSRLDVVGATMECSNANAVCVDMAASNYSNDQLNGTLFHFYTCSSNTSARRASYHFDGHCLEDDDFGLMGYYTTTDVECRCDWDGCNSRTANATFPLVNSDNATIDCYTGISTKDSLVSGGAEPCQGVCVTFIPFGEYTVLHGCVAHETVAQVGAPSADSTVAWHGSNISFCSTSLCNTASIQLTPPQSAISCYVGFGAEGGEDRQFNFYGALVNCQPGEVCAAFQSLTETERGDADFYACMNVFECAALKDYGGNSNPASWQWDGRLWDNTCCLSDKCNYNESWMGPSSSNPSLPSQTKPKAVINTFIGVHPRDREYSGEVRPCTGVAGYAEAGIAPWTEAWVSAGYGIWMCIPDESICAALNATIGTCATNVSVFDKFCCMNETIYPCPDCPLGGWKRGETVTNKCFSTVWALRSHAGAVRACKEIHGNATLPCIGSAFENSEVSTYETNVYQDIWIGLSPAANGTWTWDDGTPFSYANWAPNNPASGDIVVAMDIRTRQWKSNATDLVDDNNVACQMRLV